MICFEEGSIERASFSGSIEEGWEYQWHLLVSINGRAG